MTMKPEALDHFRELLLQREQSLRDTMARRTGGAPGALSVMGGADSPDDASVVDELNDDAFAEIQVADGEMTAVRAALDRIEEGTYGDCIDCDEPIARERLEVEPWAARCIECQDSWERAHPVTQHGSRSM